MSLTTDSEVPEPRKRRGRGRPAGKDAPLVDRDTLVQAAFTAIKASGFAVTMDDIAEAADVTKPVIYRTIGDRAAVIIAVGNELTARIAKAIEADRVANADADATFRQAVATVFHTLVEEREVFLFLDRFWADADPKLQPQALQAGANNFFAAMEAWSGSPGAPPGMEESWAYATIGVVRGVASMWLTHEYCSLDELIDHVVAFLGSRGEHRTPDR